MGLATSTLSDMAGNTFGEQFRITTFGESHGGGVGVVIDGCPPRLELDPSDVQVELDRRRPGQSRLVTQRNELKYKTQMDTEIEYQIGLDTI